MTNRSRPQGRAAAWPRLLPLIPLLLALGQARAQQAAGPGGEEEGAGGAAAELRTQQLQPVLLNKSRGLLGDAGSASEGTVSAAQLALRPLLRAAEALETVPGLIVTQHSGDGKANQYFLRGFNLDHGSDFASHLAGMPINLPSHAHGQGYSDLNLLMPELISSLRYRKGLYAAEDGDFATAGSARIELRRRLDEPLAELSLGPHAYRRALLAGSRDLPSGGALLAAVELAGNDGPWEQPEGLYKRNALLRYSEGSERQGFALTAMAYRARWTATEQVPERAIASGEIGRFGALSPSDGGITRRDSLSGQWAGSDRQGSSRAAVYVIRYGLQLYANPSGFIGSAEGDQHEQVDRRQTWGGALSRQWALPELASQLELGLQLRQDRVSELGLHETHQRLRGLAVRVDRLRQTQTGLHAELHSRWSDALRSSLGLRWDQLRGRVSPLAGEFNAGNGGAARGSQLSPKLGLVWGPLAWAGRSEFYLNWGRGFHSNDLRGATSRFSPVDGAPQQAVPVLARAEGAELGWRATPLPYWHSSLSLWQMRMGSELVYVGDEGVTEPRGSSRRLGLEWANDLALGGPWRLDADLAWSRARWSEPQGELGGRHLPNAIPFTASAALIMDERGPWSAGLRLRYLGAYALEDSGQHKSSPFWTANLQLGWRWHPQLQLRLDVLNLLNRRGNDIEYWGNSCTRAEGPACGGAAGEGLDGRLIHPMEPRSLRLALRATF